jgi:hypothetical protein
MKIHNPIAWNLSSLLASIEGEDTVPAVPEFEPNLYYYPVVDDADQPIMRIIEPNMKNGPWVAGGAALGWYNNKQVKDNDIDVFCSSEEQQIMLTNRFKTMRNVTTKHSSDFATTFYVEIEREGWTVQIIKCRYLNSAEEIIKAFDISVCEVVTDGIKFVLGDNTAYDIKHKLLRMKIPVRPDAIKRFAKYYSYGYTPVEGLFDLVVNNPAGSTEFTVDGDYNNALT